MGEVLTLSPAVKKVFQLWDIAKYNQMFIHNRTVPHGFQKLMVWQHHKYSYSQKIPLAATENKTVLCELSNTLRWPVTPLAQAKDTMCCCNTSFLAGHFTRNNKKPARSDEWKLFQEISRK